MKRALLLLLIIPLLFLPLLITPAKSSSDNESKSEIMLVVSADDITTFIIGEPDIDKVVIDGKDLDGMINSFRSDVNWARRLMRKVHWEYIIICRRLDKINELVYNLSRALNATVARVNNNTLMILDNRRNILLLAQLLNITLSELEEANSTLSNINYELKSMKEEDLYQWRAISSLRAKQLSNELKLMKEIEKLKAELEAVKAHYQELEQEQRSYHDGARFISFIVMVSFLIAVGVAVAKS